MITEHVGVAASGFAGVAAALVRLLRRMVRRVGHGVATGERCVSLFSFDRQRDLGWQSTGCRGMLRLAFGRGMRIVSGVFCRYTMYDKVIQRWAGRMERAQEEI